MSDKLNIFQRINAVRKKIDYIKKEKAVQTYKAVTHDQVTAMVRDHLVEAGIVIFPSLVSSVTIDTGEKTSKGTPIIRVEAVYEFTFVNMDDSADRFVASVSAHANDQGDKAPGKALSYAKKALVLKVFEIESGEDDESRYNEGFDLLTHMEAINSAPNKQVLEFMYLKAKEAAMAANDAAAFKLLGKKVQELLASKFAKKAEAAK